MNRPAAPLTPSQLRGAIVPQPASPIPPAQPAAPRRSGTDEAALSELRNAGATYDFLRHKGDRVQFWETLRLARSRRAIVAPPDGEPAVPTPAVEAAIVHELDSIRRQFASLVRNLRRFLKQVPGLPEPLDRFEMALAFLLASAREHQAVARWLAEPGKHEAKAAEKLRSLAAITDPYREALQPWTLQVSEIEDDPGEDLATRSLRSDKPVSPSPSPGSVPPVDARSMACLRGAFECREILAGIYLESELWETVLLATSEPEATRSALEKLSRELENDQLEQVQAGAEALFGKITELRAKYADWVRSLWASLSEKHLAPEDPRVFEVALGLMLPASGARDRVGLWLEEPQTWQDEAVGLLGPWMRRAQDYLAALKPSGT